MNKLRNMLDLRGLSRSEAMEKVYKEFPNVFHK